MVNNISQLFGSLLSVSIGFNVNFLGHKASIAMFPLESGSQQQN